MSNVLRGALMNPDAIHGKSAYEIAVMNGFNGTEEEWLDSLIADAVKQANIETQMHVAQVMNSQSNYAIPVCIHDLSGNISDVSYDLEIDTRIEMCDDEFQGSSEEHIISIVTEQNRSVTIYESPYDFSLPTFDYHFNRARTYLSLQPATTFSYLLVHLLFADGTETMEEVTGGIGTYIEMSKDINLIYIEVN